MPTWALFSLRTSGGSRGTERHRCFSFTGGCPLLDGRFCEDEWAGVVMQGVRNRWAGLWGAPEENTILL